jgi:multiple sugar transport system substrate-binding protein
MWILCIAALCIVFAGCKSPLIKPRDHSMSVRKSEQSIALMTQDTTLGKAFDAYIERAQRATGLNIKVVPEPVNPDVRQAQVTRVLSSGDSSVDVISVNDEMISMFKNSGYIDPLDKDVMTSSVMKHFPKAYMNEIVMDKHRRVYSVPTFMDILAFWIDKQKLHEAGMTEVKTKKDFVRFIKASTKGGSYGYGGAWETAYAYNELGLFVNLFGGNYYDWSNPKTRQAVKFLHDMVKNRETSLDQIADQYDQMMEKFFNKRYAAVFMYTGAMQTFVLSGRYGENGIHIAPMPKFEKKATYVAAWHYVLNSASRNKDAAKKFLQYAASEQGARDYAETLMRFPVRDDVVKDLGTSFYGLKDIQEYVNHTELHARPMANQAMGFIEAIGNLFRRYVSDEITLDRFCYGANKVVDMYIKK